MRTGPIGVTNGYFPGNVQITNANIVNAEIFGDAADGGSDPGPPGPISAAPAGTDTMMLNEGTQVGTPAFNKRFAVYGPVLLAGAITFLKPAAAVVTIDGRTTPHTSLTDFVEQLTRGAGSAAGQQRAAYVDVLTGGQLTVNTDSLAAIRAEISGAAGDVAPGGGATRPNLVGVHVVMPDTGAAGAARRCGVLIDGSGADGVAISPAIGFWGDNAHDIGLALADAIGGNRLRPRSIYAGTSVVVGASTTITTAAIDFSAAGQITAQAGVLTLRTTVAAGAGNQITISGAAAVAGAGGSIVMSGGAAAGAGPSTGGAIDVTAGNSVGASAGGSVILRAGTGGAAGGGLGGDITLQPGAAGAGSVARSGDIVFISTAGDGGARRGVFRPSVDNQNSIGVNEAGGFRWLDAILSNQVRIYALLNDANARAILSVGDATGGEVLLGRGGATIIDARVKGNGAAGAVLIDRNGAGATTVQVGATASVGVVESVDAGLTVRSRRVAAGSGDQMTLRGTDGVTVGAGGSVLVQGGNGTGAGVNAGGTVTLTAGVGAGTGTGGNITMSAGQGAAGAGGNGGTVSLTTGAAGVGSVGTGGDINVTLGLGDGAGRSGQVNLTRNNVGVAADVPVVQIVQDQVAGLAACLLLRQDDTDVASLRIRNGADGADLLSHIEADPQGHVLRFTTLAPIIEAVGVAMTLRSRVTAGAGVNLNLAAGPAIAGAGGIVNIDAGAGVGAAAGGDITIDSGAGGIGGSGGAILLTAGNAGAGAGTGGAITLQAGTVAAGGDGAGGAVSLTAGNAERTAAGANVGGNVSLTAGNADAAGGVIAGAQGGSIAITAGNGAQVVSGNGLGGDTSIDGGVGSGIGVGGRVIIRAGAGGTVAPARGGHVEITTGAAGALSAGQGGDVVVTLGAGDGVGRRGVFRSATDNQDDFGLVATRWRDLNLTRYIAWGAAGGGAVDLAISRAAAGTLLLDRAGVGAITVRTTDNAAGAGSALTVRAGDAGAVGAGGAFALRAGNGFGFADGGAVTLNSGTAGQDNVNGGDITITAGSTGAAAAGAGGRGGDFAVQAGAGNAQRGGNISLNAGGSLAGNNNGGTVGITGGTGNAIGNGGTVTITGGSPGGGGAGGSVILVSGPVGATAGIIQLRASGASPTTIQVSVTGQAGTIEGVDASTLTVQTRRATDGAGSNVTVSAAAGRATAGAVVFAGGALDLNAGNAAVFGVAGAGAAGGAITLDAGNGAAEGAFGGAGGAITLTAGVGARQGAGGNIALNAGAGGILAGGNGGSIEVVCGNAGAASGGVGGTATLQGGTGDTAGAGGAVTLASGAGGATGGGGAINLNSGAAGGGTANGGDIIINPGAGAGTGRRGLTRPGTDNQTPLGWPTHRFTRIPEAWHHSHEEFEGADNAGGIAQFTKWQATVTAGTAAPANDVLDGAILLTANGLNDASSIQHKTRGYNPTTRSTVFECIVEPTSLITTIRMEFGLTDQAARPGGGGSGVYVRYDTGVPDAFWTIVTLGGVGPGATASATAPAQNTRQRLTIEVDVGGNVRLYVNGVLGATRATAEIGNAAMRPSFYCESLVAGIRTVRANKCDIWMDNLL